MDLNSPKPSDFSTETRIKVSEYEKNKNNKAWYKAFAKKLHKQGLANESIGSTVHSVYGDKKRTNYNLVNGILNYNDFDHVIHKYSKDIGGTYDVKTPAKLTHRDILNKRLKKLQSMEAQRGIDYRIVAVNESATTRKEQTELSKIRGHVVDLIMQPIRQQAALQLEEQIKGRQLSPEEQQQIQEQFQKQIEESTPDRVRRYMKRKHQDPAEILANHILSDAVQRLEVRRKISETWKHLTITGDCCVYTGVRGDARPVFEDVNMLYLRYDLNPNIPFIEEGDWVTYEMRMPKSKIIEYWGNQLSEDEIDRIYKFSIGQDDINGYTHNFAASSRGAIFDNSSADYLSYFEDEQSSDSIPVVHCEWIGLREVGFLYDDEKGTLEFVEGNYKPKDGERLEKEWLPEKYETVIILNDIFVDMRPVPGQFRDPDRPGEVELSYKGVRVDCLNSFPTSPLDRMKEYQYLFNIFAYRVERLLAADKGKKVAIDVNLIPERAGMSIEKWMDFFEATPFVFYNPKEEGVDLVDIQNNFKVLDLSTTTQLAQYAQQMDYYDRLCGEVVGITESLLGNEKSSTEVGVARQKQVNSTSIIEPYFQTFDIFKRRALLGLLNTCKMAYLMNPPKYLNYVLDDMDVEMIRMDIGMLEESSYGLYLQEASYISDRKEKMERYLHAALQNERISPAVALKLERITDIREAEEMMEVAEEQEQMRRMEETQMAHKNAMELAEKTKRDQMELNDHITKNRLKEIDLKGQYDLQKQAMLSMGFNENKDLDNDGVPDVHELYKEGKEAEIKMKKLDIEQQKVDVQKEANEIRKKGLLQKKTISSK